MEIFLVQFSPSDYRLVLESIKTQWPKTRLTQLRTASELTAELERKHLPQLILFDINAAHPAPWEALRRVKEEVAWRRVPLVVFSDARESGDALKAYQLHANAFVEKPTDLDEFNDVMSAMLHFWLETASLPPSP